MSVNNLYNEQICKKNLWASVTANIKRRNIDSVQLKNTDQYTMIPKSVRNSSLRLISCVVKKPKPYLNHIPKLTKTATNQQPSYGEK